MHWMTIDPGETTGWAVWKDSALVFAGQNARVEHIDLVDATLLIEDRRCLEDELGWDELGWDELGWDDNTQLKLGALVCEEWQLYPDVMRTGALDYDHCRTARAIGAYELLARQHGLRFITQGAAIKKPAEAAGSRELYLTPQHENRHANDAIDHGIFYINRNGGPPC